MAIEIATAYVQLVPSARGLAANISRELAPAQAIASAEGSKAGVAFGGRFGSQLKSVLPKSIAGLNIGPLLGGALAAGAVVALAEVGGAVVKMRRIIQEQSGATGATLGRLFDTAKREATKVPASFADIAAAVSELSRRGVPLGSMFDKLAEQELFLAKVTGADLASTVDITTGLFAKFNIPLREQSRELDVLFKAQQASGKGLEPLIESLFKGGAQLQLFGFNLDHSIALIAGLERAGVNVQPVLFSLRTAFAKIAKEGKDPQTVLRGLVKELTDGKNPTLAMADAVKLFGARGGTELARAIQQGKLNVDALFKSITNGKDGIVATGHATETLADKITLLKNTAAIALAPLGIQIRNVFSDIVTQATPAVSALFSSIANVASGLIPVLAPLGLLLEGMFKTALPVMQLFADDLNTIGDALHAVPGPVLAGAATLGILAFAALGAADGMIAAGRAALVSAAEFAFTPVGAAVIAFSALVTAVTIFGKHADAAKVEAKDLGKALFNASTDAGFFAQGVTDAATGVSAYLDAQIKAGKDDGLQKILLASGQTVTQLSTHLNDGSKAWNRYANALAEATIGTKHGKDDLFPRAQEVRNVRAELDKQRAALALTAKAQLDLRISTGELTKSQVRHVIETNRAADGSINWSKVLDSTNEKLKALATQTDAAAQATAQSSPIYKVLVDQFAAGSISADTFAAVLKEKFKFSAEGAKAAAKDLTAQVKSLGDTVDKSFPAISDAAKGLKNDVVGIAADLAGRQSQFARQLAVSESLGSGASKTLRDNIASNLKGIRDDFKVLAADTDPQKFTENLLKQVQSISTFFANIKTLVSRGFPELAKTLLDLGAQAGGNLAAGFAAQPTKAKVANSALGLLANTMGAMHQWVVSHFAELSGIGQNFDQGLADGVTAGTQIITHAVSSMADSVKRHTRGAFSIGSPSKWARDEIGKNIVLGLAQGLDPQPLDAPLKKLHAQVQKNLSKPLKIGAIFEPSTFSTDRVATSLQATRPFVAGAAASNGPAVSIGTINARDDQDVARVIETQQRRARILSTL